MKIYIILIAIAFGCNRNNSNLIPEDPVEKALKEYISDSENVGEKLFLSFSDTATIYKVEALFLGKVKMNSGKFLKILNAIHFTGLLNDAVRSRAELIIFDSKNEVIGKYEIGAIDNLPTSIKEEKELIFIPDENCNLKTIVDFSNGPPENLFIECTEKGGNLYNFIPIASGGSKN